MITTRVTPATLSSGVMSGMQSTLSRLQHTQEQLASGKRLSRPSDAPVDAASSLRLRAEQQQSAQLSRNVDDGLAWLGTADRALTQTSTSVTRVRQLVVAGLNATNGPQERAAMASEVDQLRAGLLDLANTQYLGRPVFAGTQDTAVAFDRASGAYLGNSSPVSRTVSADPGTPPVQVGLPGSEVFTTMFTDSSDPGGAGVLGRISDALRSGDTAALNTALGDLDTVAEATRSAQSVVGARTNRLESLRSAGSARADTIATQLSSIEDIDLAQTITDMQIQQTAYQAALGATAKIVQPSLMDFLR